MSKVWKNLITVIYNIGVTIVCILLVFAIVRPHIVMFPDVMLPMELYELTSACLACGFLPMLIFSILFYKVHDISKSSHKIRNAILVYLPAAVCLVCALFWICVWGIGVVNVIKHLNG